MRQRNVLQKALSLCYASISHCHTETKPSPQRERERQRETEHGRYGEMEEKGKLKINQRHTGSR